MDSFPLLIGFVGHSFLTCALPEMPPWVPADRTGTQWHVVTDAREEALEIVVVEMMPYVAHNECDVCVVTTSE